MRQENRKNWPSKQSPFQKYTNRGFSSSSYKVLNVQERKFIVARGVKGSRRNESDYPQNNCDAM